ncbi:MAG: CPBP family intramembrane metalloprotease [Candidatus Sulfopaludibacter sp.]|nr:CPBP family intramembrane metalloprotease [Candidatus Sulfopaludibacter sp.]
MQTIFLAVLLGAVLSLLAPAVQDRLRESLRATPRLVWLAPPVLTAVFAGASLLAGAFTLPLTAAVLAYTAVPVITAWWHQDLLTVLLLWLPIEFAAGRSLVPVPARGFLHSAAYGIAILLGLVLFLGFRALPGMKYRAPRTRRDLRLPLVGFVAVAPVLVVVGIAIGFIPAPHLPVQPAGKMAAAAAIIFAGTALPEEILFRALIQNLLMQRLGATTRTLLLASVIFGAAHLDNGPQALPNWRYMIEATIAGVAYGKVFQRSDSVCSSAILHTLVDWTKHFWF